MNKELNQTFLRAKLLGYFFIINLALYYFIVRYLLADIINLNSNLDENFSPYLNYIFIAVFVSGFSVIQFLKKQVRSGKMNSNQDPIAKLFLTSILNYISAEIPAVLGIVLFVLQKNINIFLISLGISLILFIYFFPRFSKWEESSRKHNQNN